MTRLEHQAADWHKAAYGEEFDPAATYRKLLEEIGELGEAMMHGDSRGVFEEIGDCAFILMHLVREQCGPETSLTAAIAVALEKCQMRFHNRDANH